MNKNLNHRFCVAPMIDWTDKHCRYFHRLLTQNAVLYTEMITEQAILRGDREHLLAFNTEEHPVALQLGGCDPKNLAVAAKIGEDFGYDEINLNVGCPSDRVQQGKFGACLMAEPNLVGACIAQMQSQVAIPVTVKCRIGIDKSLNDLFWNFIETVSVAGCNTFIVHARQAWLKGLSPKENREIPPLNYSLVYEVKKQFPNLEIILNGGIQTIENSLEHLQYLDGVMLGRAAYHQPYLLSEVDTKIFGIDLPSVSRKQVLQKIIPYFEKQMTEGVALHTMLRHILGLWHGQQGSRAIRQKLSDHKISAAEKIKFLRLL